MPAVVPTPPATPPTPDPSAAKGPGAAAQSPAPPSHTPPLRHSATSSPSPELADQIVRDLLDPHSTLADIADKHNLSFDALVLWMAGDDAQKRILDLQSTIASRARLVATASL